MKRSLSAAVLTAVLLFSLPFSAGAEHMLIPVGSLIGMQLQDGTVTVAAFEEGGPNAARSAGLRIGDEILTVSGHSISSAEDVREALEDAVCPIEVTVRRGSKTRTLCFSPDTGSQGLKLGIYLRQGISGIGTVTYFDPDSGAFGTLGHGVHDPRGTLLPMKQGFAYEAMLTDVSRGRSGTPGQLRGTPETAEIFGTVLRNTPCGVFGTTSRGWTGDPVPTARFDQIRTGSATIRATVKSGPPQDYSVEILRIYPQDHSRYRNFLLKVTDPKLLEATGGIVQGMSGSPILQNGKLVGAVTHVLVNDPTRGYGIFIENMLTAAS